MGRFMEKRHKVVVKRKKNPLPLLFGAAVRKTQKILRTHVEIQPDPITDQICDSSKDFWDEVGKMSETQLLRGDNDQNPSKIGESTPPHSVPMNVQRNDLSKQELDGSQPLFDSTDTEEREQKNQRLPHLTGETEEQNMLERAFVESDNSSQRIGDRETSTSLPAIEPAGTTSSMKPAWIWTLDVRRRAEARRALFIGQSPETTQEPLLDQEPEPYTYGSLLKYCKTARELQYLNRQQRAHKAENASNEAVAGTPKELTGGVDVGCRKHKKKTGRNSTTSDEHSPTKFFSSEFWPQASTPIRKCALLPRRVGGLSPIQVCSVLKLMETMRERYRPQTMEKPASLQERETCMRSPVRRQLLMMEYDEDSVVFQRMQTRKAQRWAKHKPEIPGRLKKQRLEPVCQEVDETVTEEHLGVAEDGPWLRK